MHQISTKSVPRTAAYAVVLMVVLFLCPASVAAIPLSEYQQKLQDASIKLDTLDEEEDESKLVHESRLNETLENIRAALPRNQTIESEGEVYNVDNSWLHRALDELKNEAGREARIQQLADTLNALSARVAQREELGQAAESKGWAKSRLESILARPEYATKAKGPNALTRLIRDFIEWIKKLLPKPKRTELGAPNWLNLVARILVVLAGLAVLVFVIRLLRSRFKRSLKIKPRKKKEPRIVLGERLEPDQTATDLLSEAEALARSGDLRAAIRKAYIALLVELGDRKIISLAQHKTNRDYLNALRDVPPLHSRMRGLTDSFERHWYGFAEASQTDWQNFRDGYLATLRSGN